MDKGGSLVPIQKWLTAFFLPLDPHLGPKVKFWTLSPTLIEDLHDLQKGHGSQHWVPVISLLRKHSDFNYQSHLSPQGCLKYKRCSESGLNCRYQNPYIKLKLIGLAIRLYQKFWKQNESSNFSWLQNASIWITFWTLHVKANFVFRLFNVFLRFQGRSAKNICLRFAIFNFSKKLQNISETRLKNMECSYKNHSHCKNILKEKVFRHNFVVYVLIYPLSKFGGNWTNSLWVSEKNDLRNSTKKIYVNQTGNFYFRPKLKTALCLSMFNIF